MPSDLRFAKAKLTEIVRKNPDKAEYRLWRSFENTQKSKRQKQYGINLKVTERDGMMAWSADLPPVNASIPYGLLSQLFLCPFSFLLMAWECS